MRIPKPHWKASHKCWYVKIDGKFTRLDPDKEKAMELYKDLLGKQRVRSGATPAASLTVVDLGTTFLDWVDRHRANETYLWYRKYLHGTNAKKGKFTEAGFMNHVPAGLRVCDLKPYHLDNWLDARYPKADDDTLAGAITAVLRVFNWATDKGYIDKSPLSRVKKPQREGRGEVAYLAPQQWTKLIEAVRGGQKDFEVEAFLDYITVIKETGCRPQEIRAVEARHLDHQAKQWEFPIKESKGKKEKRIVVLGDVAYAICCRLALKHPEGPLFCNSDGKPWTNYAISCRFKRLSTKLGFRVFSYALRHTFATEAILNGVDVITVAKLMGHKDLTMLNKIYTHVTKDRQHMEQMRQKATGRMTG